MILISNKELDGKKIYINNQWRSIIVITSTYEYYNELEKRKDSFDPFKFSTSGYWILIGNKATPIYELIDSERENELEQALDLLCGEEEVRLKVLCRRLKDVL